MLITLNSPSSEKPDSKDVPPNDSPNSSNLHCSQASICQGILISRKIDLSARKYLL